jgi:uncharacterized protein YdhG (YjbR/CyaY superfamily)
MQSTATTPDQYISELPEDRRIAMEQLRKVVSDTIPAGFKEVMSYGMLGYCVPHEIYPSGYHCNPKDPLPFFAMASQKNSINIYHMMLYADKEMYDWFVTEYPKHCKSKLDMGKSCIRFKKMDDIPYELIGELMTKVTVDQWIETYESNLKK